MKPVICPARHTSHSLTRLKQPECAKCGVTWPRSSTRVRRYSMRSAAALLWHCNFSSVQQPPEPVRDGPWKSLLDRDLQRIRRYPDCYRGTGTIHDMTEEMIRSWPGDRNRGERSAHLSSLIPDGYYFPAQHVTPVEADIEPIIFGPVAAGFVAYLTAWGCLYTGLPLAGRLGSVVRTTGLITSSHSLTHHRGDSHERLL